MAGRKTKLTPEVAEVILTAVSHGVPDKYAARAAGIHPETLANWRRRGEAEANLEIDPDDYTKDKLIEIAEGRDIEVSKSWTKAKIASEINAHHSPFFEFFESLTRAEAEFLQKGMEEILKMSLENRDWRGVLALLERRFPDVMGRVSPRSEGMEEFEGEAGTEEEAQRILDVGEEIVVKMLEAG